MEVDPARPVVPPKILQTDYPVIDVDPHVTRVFRYARPSDWLLSIGLAGAIGPGSYYLFDKYHPAAASRQSYMRGMRLVCGISATFAVLNTYQRSVHRFLGFRENSREEAMDMREMVDKVKRGEPLYGVSGLSSYHQHVAYNNSRYASMLLHVIPWANFVNHPYHGVDTAKYYRQAEKELEAERLAREGPLLA